MNIGSLSVFNPCFIRGYGKFRVSAESAKSADALTPALSHPMGEGAIDPAVEILERSELILIDCFAQQDVSDRR